jgi:hypothetical protein
MKKFLVRSLLKMVPSWLMHELFYAYFAEEAYRKQKVSFEQINDFWVKTSGHCRDTISQLLDTKRIVEKRQKMRQLMKTPLTEEEANAGILSKEEWDVIKPEMNTVLNKEKLFSNIGGYTIHTSRQQCVSEPIQLGKNPILIGTPKE